MERDPILAARTLPAGTDGYRVPLTFRVEGGLEYIRGNAAPYFSLTYTQHRKGFPEQCYSGGAGHETIRRYYGARFDDLAALHLSDIDGVPMHAEANGWYWLAGALPGGAGERYHGGNADVQHWHADGSWNRYGVSTLAECLETFARHCRITASEAEDIRARVAEAGAVHGWPEARQLWRDIMNDMRPRWKTEAQACIAAHHLRVYGDPWPPAAE